jgi:hypothetical protein
MAADEIDQANEMVEFTVEQMRKVVARASPEAVATGACLSCEKGLEEGRRWCDADCRDDWSREKRLRR